MYNMESGKEVIMEHKVVYFQLHNEFMLLTLVSNMP